MTGDGGGQVGGGNQLGYSYLDLIAQLQLIEGEERVPEVLTTVLAGLIAGLATGLVMELVTILGHCF
jgi:hypothetical protein